MKIKFIRIIIGLTFLLFIIFLSSCKKNEGTSINDINTKELEFQVNEPSFEAYAKNLNSDNSFTKFYYYNIGTIQDYPLNASDAKSYSNNNKKLDFNINDITETNYNNQSHYNLSSILQYYYSDTAHIVKNNAEESFVNFEIFNDIENGIKIASKDDNKEFFKDETIYNEIYSVNESDLFKKYNPSKWVSDYKSQTFQNESAYTTNIQTIKFINSFDTYQKNLDKTKLNASFSLNKTNKKGYYRYTITSNVKVFLVLVLDEKTNKMYQRYIEFPVDDTFSYKLQYSPSNEFTLASTVQTIDLNKLLPYFNYDYRNNIHGYTVNIALNLDDLLPSFNYNQESNNTVTTKLNEIEKQIIKKGYAVEKWYLDKEYTQVFDKNTKVNTNINLYVKLNKPYKIIYHSRDDEENVVVDVRATEETSIIANKENYPGYTFVGWNTKEDGSGVAYNVNEIVINLSSGEDFNLYPIWEANKYTVKYNSNGATNNEVTQVYTYDVGQNLLSNQYSKVGYSFINWNTSSDNTGVSYANNAFVKNLTDTNQITLYAIWQANNYKVIFNSNGVDGEEITQTLTYDESSLLATSPLTKIGYHIAYWNTLEDNSGLRYELNTSYKNLTTGNNITLYAIWVPNEYNVVFVSNQGNEADVTQRFIYDLEGRLNENTFTRKGYTFKYWNTTHNDRGIRYNNRKEILNISTGETIILYAQWQANEYTINFDSNGGEGRLASITVEYGNTIELPKNTIKRMQYHFGGWEYEVDGVRKYYSDEAVALNVITSGEVTFYAKWNPFVYFISFISDNGAPAASNQQLVKYGESTKLNINHYYKENYYFLGWSTSQANRVVKYYDGEYIMNLSTKDNDMIYLFPVWSTFKYIRYTKNYHGSIETGLKQVNGTTETIETLFPSYSGFKITSVYDQINDRYISPKMNPNEPMVIYITYTREY